MFLKEAIENLTAKFKHAIAGVFGGIAHDRSLRIHYIIALVVIVVFYVLEVTFIEWALIFLGIGIVIGLEYLNSSIELLCDHVEEEYHDTIKKIKDFGAAAVFVSSIFVALMGIVIIIQYIG